MTFRAMFEQSPALCLLLDTRFCIVAATDAYLAATMTVREHIVGRSLFDVFPDNPADPAADGVRNLKASLERVRTTARADAMAVQKYDVRRPEAEGGGFEVRHWSPRNWPVIDGGALAFIVHQVEDVTAFMQLRERADNQSSLNDALKTHAGRMEAEVVNRAKELQATNTQLRAAEEQLRRFNEELEQRVRTESEARARAEDQFRQAQKMEALGLLAGGVAHDFNNLLTVMLSCSALVLEELNDGHAARADVLGIEEAARRAAGLTRQLLAFSRRQVLSPTTLNLNDVVLQSQPLLRRLLGEDIELASVCAKELSATRADRGLIEQVLMNLVVNARDAMPRGGTITIETSNLELDENSGGCLGAAPGRYVMLAVTDTGCGMTEDTKERLFLPFFTTKAVGRGTGLGLSMVHGVVKQSGGELLVYSVLGKGSTIKVCLPREARVAEAEAAVASVVEPLPHVRLLLVEDEEVVRSVAARILRREGVSVVAASSPLEALELCRDEATQFDVVLTDVVMPSMDGPSFIERLAEVRSGFRVVFMSGYTGGALVHQHVLGSNATFLQKPFTPSQLLGRLRDALSGPLWGLPSPASARRSS